MQCVLKHRVQYLQWYITLVSFASYPCNAPKTHVGRLTCGSDTNIVSYVCQYICSTAVLCGVMGYRWFFAPEWLQKILSWQDEETGCFKGKAIFETEVGELIMLLIDLAVFGF